MTPTADEAADGRAHSDDPRRLVVYAVSRAVGGIDDYVFHAVEQLRPHAASLVVTVPATASAGDRERLGALADSVTPLLETGDARRSVFETFNRLNAQWYRATRRSLDSIAEIPPPPGSGNDWATFGEEADVAGTERPDPR